MDSLWAHCDGRHCHCPKHHRFVDAIVLGGRGIVAAAIVVVATAANIIEIVLLSLVLWRLLLRLLLSVVLVTTMASLMVVMMSPWLCPPHCSYRCHCYGSCCSDASWCVCYTTSCGTCCRVRSMFRFSIVVGAFVLLLRACPFAAHHRPTRSECGAIAGRTGANDQSTSWPPLQRGGMQDIIVGSVA